MKSFSDIIQKSKTIVLTDSLPSVQLMKSSKSKDSTVFSLIVKLAGEFPNLSVQYSPGHKNLSDVFSRPSIDSHSLDFSKNHIPRWNEEHQEFAFFENVSEWLESRRIEQNNELKVQKQGFSEKDNKANTLVECKDLIDSAKEEKGDAQNG